MLNLFRRKQSKRKLLQKRLRNMRKTVQKEVQNEWKEFTNQDLHRIEDELDHIVDLFEKRYGYNSEQAVAELERYVQKYSDRTRKTIKEHLSQISKPSNDSMPYIWGIAAVTSLILFLRYSFQSK